MASGTSYTITIQTMLATVLHGVNDIRVDSVPKPSAGPGEAVLKITATSICGTDGTDLHIVTTLCPGGKERMRRLINVVQSGCLDPTMLMSHKFSLEDIKEGYELFGNREDGVLKVLITP